MYDISEQSNISTEIIPYMSSEISHILGGE